MFRSVEEIIKANREAGHHFFSRSTMRFFNSLVYAGALEGGRYFITSERYAEEARRYTIRVANEQGHVDTVGEFQQYATLNQAKRALKALGQDVRQEAGK